MNIVSSQLGMLFWLWNINYQLMKRNMKQNKQQKKATIFQ
jgi:hypothetical protein